MLSEPGVTAVVGPVAAGSAEEPVAEVGGEPVEDEAAGAAVGVFPVNGAEGLEFDEGEEGFGGGEGAEEGAFDGGMDGGVWIPLAEDGGRDGASGAGELGGVLGMEKVAVILEEPEIPADVGGVVVRPVPDHVIVMVGSGRRPPPGWRAAGSGAGFRCRRGGPRDCWGTVR